MNYNCLIVDDEIDLAKATEEYFSMFDITSCIVTNSSDCIDFFKSNECDVILLDINLGTDSGFALCKKLREQYETPIFFISARQSDDDILIALNIGGDDYIKKPYTLSVLTAKIRNTIKRSKKVIPILDYNGIRIDENTMKLFIKEKAIQLKAKEFKLFKYLFENKNKIVSKDDLFNHVWEDEFFSDGTLNVHIRRLREKIEEDPNNPVMIKTIWGTGYILEI